MYKNLLFSKRLKELRKESGVTQSVLAEKLEVSCLTYSNYEHGKSVPTVETILNLCNIFDVSADYLLGMSNSRHMQYEEAQALTGLSESSINALKALRTAGSGMLTMLDMLIGSDTSIPGIHYPDYSDTKPNRYYDENNEMIDPHMISAESLIQSIAAEWYDNDHPFTLDENSGFDVSTTPAPFHQFSDKEKATFARIIRQQKKHPSSAGLLNTIYRFLIFKGNYSTFGSGHEIPLSDNHPIHLSAKGFFVDFPSKEADKFCEYALEKDVITALNKFKRIYWKQISKKNT